MGKMTICRKSKRNCRISPGSASAMWALIKWWYSEDEKRELCRCVMVMMVVGCMCEREKGEREIERVSWRWGLVCHSRNLADNKVRKISHTWMPFVSDYPADHYDSYSSLSCAEWNTFFLSSTSLPLYRPHCIIIQVEHWKGELIVSFLPFVLLSSNFFSLVYTIFSLMITLRGPSFLYQTSSSFWNMLIHLRAPKIWSWMLSVHTSSA